MTTDQLHLERRAAQRFDFQLPVGVRLAGADCEGYGFTQDLSGRGVFFYTDFQVAEGDEVELTLVMPSEITLTENTRVRCRGKVVRVVQVQQKFGVAVRLKGYEYLPNVESAGQISASFPRISAEHGSNQPVENPPLPGSSAAVNGVAATQLPATQIPTTQIPTTQVPTTQVAATKVAVSSVTLERPETERLGNG